MANTDPMNNWVLIQQGVRDTERLIGQKQYNLSMVKARQTLEFMVKCLAERSGIQHVELIDTIDELYRSHIISKTTCEHYHKIRMIGNKATHEQDSNAYNANSSYHLLSQEVYTFASDYTPKKRGRAKANNSKNKDRRAYSSSNHSETQKSIFPFSLFDILKVLIPLLVIIFLVSLIHIVKPKTIKETVAPETTVETTLASSEESPTEAVDDLVYKTTASLNVRSAPSTDGDKLATLPSGTIVDFISTYDDDWAVINYDGGQAYVSSKFLTTQ